MIPTGLTYIYDYIQSILGPYNALYDSSTDTIYVDWCYIISGICLIVVLYWTCKSVFALLKALLGGVASDV